MNVYIRSIFVGMLVVVFTFPHLVHAQRKERPVKPTLLVYGSDVEAFTVALQSAKSNVPTLWVLNNDQFVPSLTAKDVSLAGDIHIDGGIWREFLTHVSQGKTLNDTIAMQTKKSLSARVAQNELRNILSKQKNLTVLENVSIQRLAQTKRGWNLILSDRSRYELRTLVDASANLGLIRLLGMDETSFVPNSIVRTQELSKELTRTLCAIGLENDEIYGFTLQNILKEEQGNVFVINSLNQFGDDEETIPLRMNYAQAIGVAAAYTAFFRKSLADVDPRTLQNELLTYGARIAPYVDVSGDHPHFRALQRIYLAGIFENTDNQFNGQDSVRFDEVAPVLNQLYSRSQLWFHEHKGGYLHLKDVIGLVKFLGMRGDEIDRQIEREWGKKLKFEKEFDLERLATREEFAVLLDMFSSPFSVRVSKEGKIQR